MSAGERACPGCGLRLPVSERAFYDGYFNTSAECWSLYTEALEVAFSHAVVFGQVHQLSVDAYAVRAWAEDVWRAWSSHHEAVARFAAKRRAAG